MASTRSVTRVSPCCSFLLFISSSAGINLSSILLLVSVSGSVSVLYIFLILAISGPYFLIISASASFKDTPVFLMSSSIQAHSSGTSVTPPSSYPGISPPLLARIAVSINGSSLPTSGVSKMATSSSL